MKVVANVQDESYYGLSDEAIELFAKKKGIKLGYSTRRFTYLYEEGDRAGEEFDPEEFSFDDPALVEVVEELGSRASEEGARLVVIKS